MFRWDQIDMFEKPIEVRYSRYVKATGKLKIAEDCTESMRNEDDHNLGYYEGALKIMDTLFPEVRWDEVI